MMNRRFSCFVFGFAFAASAASPRPAAANAPIQATYDTVDSVEIRNDQTCLSCTASWVVTVKGIPVGGSVSSSQSFNFLGDADIAAHCERQAMIAMSKPGKYQFGIGGPLGSSGHGVCKLIRVAL